MKDHRRPTREESPHFYTILLPALRLSDNFLQLA